MGKSESVHLFPYSLRDSGPLQPPSGKQRAKGSSRLPPRDAASSVSAASLVPRLACALLKDLLWHTTWPSRSEFASGRRSVETRYHRSPAPNVMLGSTFCCATFHRSILVDRLENIYSE